MYIPSNWPKVFNDPVARNGSLWMIYVSGFFLLNLAPEDILDRSWLLLVFTDVMSRIIPSIDKWTELSAFPQQTKLFITYSWFTVPIQVTIISSTKEAEKRFLTTWTQASTTGKYLRAPGLLLFVSTLLFLAVNFAIPDTPPCRVCVNSSRFAQAMMGGLISFSIAGLATLVVWWIRNCKKIYFSSVDTQGKDR